MSGIKTKLKKILELAERGVGGEKQNARRVLKRLLKKHNMTIADISRSEERLCWFNPSNKFEKELLVQCCAVVINKWGIDTRHLPKKKCVGFMLTPLDYLELKSMFDYYKKRWEEEVEILLVAFIQKQGLYPVSSKDEEQPNISIEESKRLRRALRFSSVINKGNYVNSRHQLGRG